MNVDIHRRIYDPINYREACFYIAYKNLSESQIEYLEYDLKEPKILFVWLGSNCGQYYLRDVQKLIDEYPYKDENTSDEDVKEKHKKWIDSRI
jgi:penicillin-binding protein-related factor A (putative recombinase)